MSETKLDEALTEANKDFEAVFQDTATEFKPDPNEKKLSERAFKIAMAKAYKERNEKVKENKRMIDEMNLEVSYRKAQADILRYRFELMDFFLKNQELEPVYLAKIEEYKLKETQADKPTSILD